MVDALRADRLGVNGEVLPLTPQIDALAADGVNFTQAFAHSTWTKPSIATLFTSVYPSQHGLDQVAVTSAQGMGSEILPGSLVTLAETFQAAGYATGAVVNQVHITPRFGFDQGFDHFQARRGTGAPRLNRQLLAWLDSIATGDRPFFAYLHYLDVHWPYTKRLAELSPQIGSLTLSAEPPRSGKEAVREWASALDLPRDLAALEARYDHEVAYADRAIGTLIQGLRERQLYEPTIVVVTADHGEAFLEHGELLHGHAPWEELIHVPLVLRLPAAQRGAKGTIDTPVGLIDLMPSLLDLAGLAIEPGAQGRSFVPLLHDGPERSRLIFAETDTALAVRSRDRKLIDFVESGPQQFDLRRDPSELRPLTDDCGEPCTRLERRLADFATAMASARQRLDTATAPLEEQDLEDMKALGYLD